MDRERSGSLLNRYQPQQNVLPYKGDLTIQKMLHAKCDVVKLVRDQMNRIDDSTVNKELQDCLKFVNSHLRLLHKKSHFFQNKNIYWKNVEVQIPHTFVNFGTYSHVVALRLWCYARCYILWGHC